MNVTIVEATPTAFSGNFSLNGAEHIVLKPADFLHFPTGVSQVEPPHLHIARSTEIRPGASGPKNTSRIHTNNPGGESKLAERKNAGDPCAEFDNGGPSAPMSLSGTYKNALPINPADQSFAGAVTWSYSNLEDSGGQDGTFSGSFSFKFVGKTVHRPRNKPAPVKRRRSVKKKKKKR